MSVHSPTEKPRLMEQVRNCIRRRHYSIRTEQSYIDLLESGYDIRTVQELLGHQDVSTPR